MTYQPLKTYMRRACQAALLLVMAAAVAACSGNDDLTEDALPDGMGALTVEVTTRGATGNYLDPTPSMELIQNYTVVFAQDNTVKKIVTSNSNLNTEKDRFRVMMAPGNYTAYSFANMDFATLYPTVAEGGAIPDGWAGNTAKLPVATTNGWNTNIPMTGHQDVEIVEGENQPFVLELVRAMAKLQFDFRNYTNQEIRVLGYEIEPLTKLGNSRHLFEKATPDVTSSGDTEFYARNFADPYPDLAAYGGGSGYTTATVTDYVNESNASYTAPVDGHISLRFKIQRLDATTLTWKTEELRFGFTGYGTDDPQLIRRNDWIKIPIAFKDWQFRVEALGFAPIAGYPIETVKSDALSVTFRTGGWVILNCYAHDNSSTLTDGTWYGLDDPHVEFVSIGELSGDTGIIETPFTYDDVAHTITGQLKDDARGTIILRINVKLYSDPDSPSSAQEQTFTCKISVGA